MIGDHIGGGDGEDGAFAGLPRNDKPPPAAGW